jgi:hypothetical protein
MSESEQAPQVPSYEFSFGDMRPAEIVAVVRYARELENSSLPDTYANYVMRQSGWSPYDAMTVALDKLVEADPERGREVVTAFVDSPDPEDRYEAALVTVQSLTKVDHDAGVDIWERLICDEVKEVRV